MDNRSTISNTLQNMIDEIINENPRTQRQYNRRNNYENENIIQLLREVLHSQDDRMREYSENMRMILQILSLLVQRQYYSRTYVDPTYDYTNRREQQTQSNSRNNTNTNRRSEIPRPTTRTRQNNYQSQILSYVIYPFLDLSGSLLNPPRFQDVVVYPTGEQINSATRIITYNESIELINHRCPISLADFEEGEDIRQIIHCGHCFCEDSIQNWFRSNVRCPVCRYDIRDYSLPDIIDASSSTPNRQNRQNIQNIPNIPNNINNNLNNLNHIFDGISTNLTNILSNYLDNDFGHTNELSYTFEFPVMYSDLSGNT
jgi:hypothetical protein